MMSIYGEVAFPFISRWELSPGIPGSIIQQLVLAFSESFG